MSLEDQKLDELLRSVKVPSDLHARLHAQLMDQASVESEDHLQSAASVQFKPNKHSNLLQRRTWWIIATAASLLLVVGGAILWQFNFSHNGNPNSQIAATPNPTDDPSASRSLEGLDLTAIEELDRQIAAQKAILLELERQELEQQIEVTRRELVKLRAKPQLNDSSLTLAVVAETALKAGASPKVIRDDLKFVIDRFPNSAGADRASKLLTTLN